MTANQHFYRDDLRMGITRPHSSWNQAAWFIDPQNRTGLADDRNDGLTSSTPVQTWNGGVINKYGCLDPVLPQFTTFTFLSGSATDGTDPVIFYPTLANQSGMRITGQLGGSQLVASGALASVATVGGILQADLGASAAVGQILVNTTAGKASRCHVLANVSGHVFQLSQPHTISDNWPLSGDPAPVTNYANTDTFQLYSPDAVDILKLMPIVSTFDVAQANEFTVVQKLAVLNPVVGQTNYCYLPDTFAMVDCRSDRRIILERGHGMGRNSIFWNCNMVGIVGGTRDIQGQGNKPWMMGGALGRGLLDGFYLDNNAILRNSQVCRLLSGYIGAIVVDTGSTLQIADEVLLAGSISGGGAVDVKKGRLFLSGVTAVASLLQTGGLAINGQTSAFSATLANPSVINGAVSLTPAHIDAAAGTAGFGGNAFIPGGGSIATFG